MAKVKREKTDFEKKAYAAFAGMPIDKWVDFIKANAKDAKEERKYKVIARRSLNLGNMKKYIEAHDNTKDARQAFKDGTWGETYVKDPETKKFVLDAKGNKIPAVDKDGNPVKVQSLVYAVEYFVNTYLKEIKVDTAPQKGAFDALKDW